MFSSSEPKVRKRDYVWDKPSNYPAGYRTVSTLVDRDTNNRLKQVAKALGTTRSQVIRDHLMRWLAENEGV
jgi:hypothetical protein